MLARENHLLGCARSKTQAKQRVTFSCLDIAGCKTLQEAATLNLSLIGAFQNGPASDHQLRVLESAGIVHSVHKGRETRFEFDLEPMAEAREHFEFVSEQWDEALSRLKAFIED